MPILVSMTKLKVIIASVAAIGAFVGGFASFLMATNTIQEKYKAWKARRDDKHGLVEAVA